MSSPERRQIRERLAPAELGRRCQQLAGAVRVTAAASLAGRRDQPVEFPDVHGERRRGTQPERAAVGAQEVSGSARPPVGLEQAAEVDEGDPQVAPRSLGVVIGPQQRHRAVAGERAGDHERGQQLPDPCPAQLGRVDDSAVPADLERPDQPYLEGRLRRLRQAGQQIRRSGRGAVSASRPVNSRRRLATRRLVTGRRAGLVDHLVDRGVGVLARQDRGGPQECELRIVAALAS